MAGLLDFLQGAVGAGVQARQGAQAAEMQGLPLLIQLQQSLAAHERQQRLDALNERHVNAEIDNLTRPHNKVVYDANGNPVVYNEYNPQFPAGFKTRVPADPVKTHEANRLFDVQHPLPARPATPGSGEQVLATPDGIVIVDKKSATSRRVAAPGATVSAESPTGQLQPRASGNQRLQQMAIENRNQMNVIDEAIKRVRANPGAVGAKNLLPDILMQRMDPEGVATRAAVADIGSLKIHERSGAAVTAAESPRLMPFVPGVRDTPDAVIQKLSRLRAYLDQETKALEAAGASRTGPVGSTGPAAGPSTASKYSPNNPFAPRP